MRIEIRNHWQKLLKISSLDDEHLQLSFTQILSKIRFINEEIIPLQIWIDSERIVSEIDKDDIDFVALTTFLNGTLWNGDKALFNGLKNIYFKHVINTPIMQEIWLHQY